MKPTKPRKLREAGRTASRTVLGIDVSSTHVHLAQLKQDAKGISLVKSASARLPENGAEPGQSCDWAVLTNVIRNLKRRHRMDGHKTAVSLRMGTIVTHVIEMPKPMPANISQFVRDEIRQYVTLSGERITLDYCGLMAAGDRSDKIFIAAAERDAVAQTVRACGQAGVTVETAEPALTACIRALHSHVVAGKFDRNSLLCVVGSDGISTCVFRKQALDFVRTKRFEAQDVKQDEVCAALADQISAVIQFYELERPAQDKWAVTIVAENSIVLPVQASRIVQSRAGASQVDVWTEAEACEKIAADLKRADASQTSLAAVGLAFGLLDGVRGPCNVNLLPAETVQSRSLKRQLLVTANIVAVVLLLMVLAVHGVTVTINKVNKNIEHDILDQPRQATAALVAQELEIDVRLKQLGDEPKRLREIIQNRPGVDWRGLLADVRDCAPKSVCITHLLARDNQMMTIEGYALSFEGAHLFANALDQSAHIAASRLDDATRQSEHNGAIKYEISCALKARAPEAGRVR